MKKTIERKLHRQKKCSGVILELKGYRTIMPVKRYFYDQIAEIPFDIYSVTLDKRRAFEKSLEEKHRVYDYVAGLVLDAIPFENAQTRVKLIIDKSKSKPQIQEFNSYVINQLQGKLRAQIPIDIHHRSSVQEYGLQAADMFSWGIFRKYESGDSEWFDTFCSKVKCDRLYPPK